MFQDLLFPKTLNRFNLLSLLSFFFSEGGVAGLVTKARIDGFEGTGGYASTSGSGEGIPYCAED